jgi:hypothetical protein
MGSAPSPMQWALWTASLGVKRLGHDADHLHPRSTKVKKMCSYTPTPPLCLCGMNRYNNTLTLQLQLLNIIP